MSPLDIRCLQRVESGFCHSRTRASLSSDLRGVADALVLDGLLRVCPKRGRFPRRYVVTASGSHALGTFLMCSDDFSREVYLARSARKAA